MIVRLTKSYLKGEINAITSKSYAHRLMICDFISGKEIDVSGFILSNDILATKRCLDAIKNNEKVLDAGESGSTLRFILPLVAVLGLEVEIKMGGKLPERPNDNLLECIKNGGASFERVGSSIFTKGKLVAGNYTIKADKSSQYLSGLIMALSMLKEKSQIKVTTPIASKPYVDITIEVLRFCGYQVAENNGTFTILGKNSQTEERTVEGDWSNSAFFLVAGALNGEITIKGLNKDSVQGDKKIIDILKSARANINFTKDSVTVRKSKLKSFTMSANDCPDLVPICAVLGANAKGKTKIHDIERLKIKESDRVLSTTEMLKACGIKTKVKKDCLIVYGGKVSGGVIKSYNDHRIVMSGAVLSLVADGDVIIKDANAVDKSYPTFFEDFKSLGGKLNAEI